MSPFSGEPSNRCAAYLGLSGSVEVSATASDHLASRLVKEMARRWRAGERPRAEEFLDEYPELGDRPESAVRLIYEEICLRQESGEDASSAEVLRRFPQWHDQLEVLLDCHRLLRAEPADPVFPVVGDVLDDFRLLAELGRGGQGLIFLATQPGLADRPVVVKVTSCEGGEHLSLARLQHRHIVPLYSVRQDPARNRRILCMPYYGAVTLAQVLEALRDKRPTERTGHDILAVIDRAQAAAPVALSGEGPARRFLAGASFVQAVCGIGVCLAEALQYAHERALVHLDLKPSNVLLAADGQPLLLDFHLAREPLPAGAPAPSWLGGTPAYTSAEQDAALEAVRKGQPIPAALDRRSDIYSLGMVLYEALGGALPRRDEPPVPLSSLNPLVSVGLADVVGRCLAPRAEDRYAEAADLAADLRRHLENQPLRGVANRSLAERWRKWHSRQRIALTWTRRLALVLVGALAAGAAITYAGRLHEEAKTALADGRDRLKNYDYEGAFQTLQRGMTLTEYLPASGELRQALADALGQTDRTRTADRLHRLVEQLRFAFGVENPDSASLRRIDDQCRQVWEARARLAGPPQPQGTTDREAQVRSDLLDLAVLWTDLRVRSASAADAGTARAEALQILAEAGDLLGQDVILSCARRRYASPRGEGGADAEPGQPIAEPPPRTPWEHCTRGRWLLRDGDLARAAVEFDRAARLQPQDLWPHFYLGVCAYRLRRYEEAVAAFRVCVALAPKAPECYYNRALALAALGRVDPALDDYNRALQHRPEWAPVLLSRGILLFQRKRYTEALGDLASALECGADPAAVYFESARIHLAQHDRAGALACLQRALHHNANHSEARDLLKRLRRKP